MSSKYLIITARQDENEVVINKMTATNLLIKRVNEKLKEGWDLAGGIGVTYMPEGEIMAGGQLSPAPSVSGLKNRSSYLKQLQNIKTTAERRLTSLPPSPQRITQMWPVGNSDRKLKLKPKLPSNTIYLNKNNNNNNNNNNDGSKDYTLVFYQAMIKK